MRILCLCLGFEIPLLAVMTQAMQAISYWTVAILLAALAGFAWVRYGRIRPAVERWLRPQRLAFEDALIAAARDGAASHGKRRRITVTLAGASALVLGSFGPAWFLSSVSAPGGSLSIDSAVTSMPSRGLFLLVLGALLVIFGSFLGKKPNRYSDRVAAGQSTTSRSEMESSTMEG